MIASLPRLHAVTDDRVVGRGDLPERAGVLAAAAGGALAVHLRTRVLPGAALLELARHLAAALEPHGSWLIVNDRLDVARAAGARAVQLGRSSLAAADARRVAPDTAVGRSVHDASEIEAAAAEGADYVVAGPVYPTASHPGATGRGPALVRTASASGLPVVAIGGLTPATTPDVVAAGAWGVAAVRGLFDAPDPAAAARAFAAALPPTRTVPVLVNGESREVDEGITLRGLLARLRLDPRAVVVELNRRIVRRDDLAATPLAAGDTVELVHFVGGG